MGYLNGNRFAIAEFRKTKGIKNVFHQNHRIVVKNRKKPTKPLVK